MARRQIGAAMCAAVFGVAGYALATTAANAGVLIEPGHFDFGWREVAYAAVSGGMFLLNRSVRGVDKRLVAMDTKHDKIFKWLEGLERRLSRLEGAHESNHRGRAPKPEREVSDGA